MLPHLGAGVGQGFEDVYTICRLLGYAGTTKATLDVSVLFSVNTITKMNKYVRPLFLYTMSSVPLVPILFCKEASKWAMFMTILVREGSLAKKSENA